MKLDEVRETFSKPKEVRSTFVEEKTPPSKQHRMNQIREVGYRAFQQYDIDDEKAKTLTIDVCYWIGKKTTKIHDLLLGVEEINCLPEQMIIFGKICSFASSTMSVFDSFLDPTDSSYGNLRNLKPYLFNWPPMTFHFNRASNLSIDATSIELKPFVMRRLNFEWIIKRLVKVLKQYKRSKASKELLGRFSCFLFEYSKLLDIFQKIIEPGVAAKRISQLDAELKRFPMKPNWNLKK